MELIDALVKVGFTRHESLLYLTLCKEGELSGYEAAKLSGISRSNAYLALAGLVEKGGAYRSESETVRYAPVAAEEFVANLRREFGRIIDFLKENLPEREQSKDFFLTISGMKTVVDKIKNMIEQAESRLYLSLDRPELNLVAVELMEAIRRDLKVVIMTDEPWEVAGCNVYCRTNHPGQIRLIADSEVVLTGELSLGGSAQCIYSKNKNLVQLIKDSLTNEMKLIGLHDDVKN